MHNSKLSFHPKKILMINIFGIGDVLFTTPLLANLKGAFPDAEIGYMCNRRSLEILENNPKVDRVFFYERDDFVAAYKRSKTEYINKLRDFWGEIKKENYD